MLRYSNPYLYKEAGTMVLVIMGVNSAPSTGYLKGLLQIFKGYCSRG